MAQPHPQNEKLMRGVCEWIAAHPRCTRSDIYRGLHLQGTVSESTVYRWIEQGISQGLLSRTGNTSAAVYEATDALRIEVIRKQLSSDHHKRPRVGYNMDWLDDYIPNKTSYLRPKDLSRLTARCMPGSAPLSKLNDHDVSIFMCDLSYASSRLEGNDYDYASTIQLAEHHVEMIGGSYRDKVMILNHRDAARYIIDSIRAGDKSFNLNPHVLRGIHAILSHDLMKDPLKCGALRTSHVEVYQSSYIPMDIPDRISDTFTKILEKASAITNPYEQSFFLLVHMPYLQPFEDCNKRTARVICNIPLLQGGVTPISWMDVTNRPRDYSDAIISVYEHNDTLMLSEIFIDCFMRSTERFSLLQRQKNPDPVAAKYRQEIKSCVRAKVLEGVDSIPNSVAVEDLSDFVTYIDAEIETLKQNEMLGLRYGLSAAVLQMWIRSLGEASPQESSNDTEVEPEDTEQVERMRA